MYVHTRSRVLGHIARAVVTAAFHMHSELSHIRSIFVFRVRYNTDFLRFGKLNEVRAKV